MDSINIRRWPRYHVHLPVFIMINSGVGETAVPGLVSELSRSGMELYGGVNLQPGELMEVEFQTSGNLHVTGVVRNRSGFCFGLEFCAAWKEPRAADDLESFIFARHETCVKKTQENINRSLQTLVEMKKCRKEIQGLANALDEWVKTRQKHESVAVRTRFSKSRS
ncbi:MAG: PilZ domain-containing protein [Candidatus Sulfotelmatobacter sp.]